MKGPQKSLASNIRAAFGGELVQVLLSVTIFFGLAWRLSSLDFGYFVAVNAAGLIIGTFANMGAQEILVREVARGADLGHEWGVTLASQAVGASAGLLLGVAIRPVFFEGVSVLTAVLLLLTNMVFFWTVEGCVRCGQAIRELAMSTRARLFFAIGRVMGVGVFVLTGSDDLDTYALIALPFGTVGTLAAMYEVYRVSGHRPVIGLPRLSRIRQGLPFIGSAGAQDMLAAFDRPLLSSYGFVVETGSYGIADRVLRLAGVPTMSVVRATQADFFETGARDLRAAFDLAKKHVRPTAAYGLLVIVVAVAAAPFMDPLVPERFEPVIPMVAALSAIPLLQALQVFPANMLTGADREGTRLSIYGSAVLVNVTLNLALIPTHSWKGAAAATIVAEAFLAFVLWNAAYRVSRRLPLLPGR